MNKNLVHDAILHRKKDTSLSLQELKIMSVFTSPKWPKKTYHNLNNTVNTAERKEIQSNEKLISIESYDSERIKKLNLYPKNTDQEKYTISENTNISKKSNDSFQLLLKEKKKIQNNIKSSNKNRNKSNEFSEVHSLTNTTSENVSLKTLKLKKNMAKSGSKLTSNKDSSIENFVFEDQKSMTNKKDEDLNNTVYVTNSNADSDKLLKFSKNSNKLNEIVLLTSPNNFEKESYYNRIFSEERGTSVKRDSAFTSLLSSKESYCNKALINNDLDDISNSDNSETADSSSKWSLNTSTITRDVINQAQLCDLATEKQIEVLANDEAVEMMIKKTKVSLGKFLVEGLYEVSRNYRNDPFTSLGIWLLIQADIRDEYNIGQESYDSNED